MAWSASPTTMMLRCSSARVRTSSHSARLVSWNSSTSTWAKRARHCDATSGWRRQPLRVEVEVAQDVAGQADGVGLVVDRERRAHPEVAGLPPEDPGAGGVE